MKSVSFKSLPEYYEKEYDGRKPNTIRAVDYETDGRFHALKEWSETGELGHICIINSETKDAFMREITDISYWGEFVIISWRHEG